MRDLLFLFIGWLLGLFGPWLTDLIQRPYRRAQIKRSLFIELKGLQFKIARLSIMTSGENDYEDVLPPEALKSLLTLDDSQIQALSTSAAQRGGGLNLKNYDAPFLAANVPSLSLFSPEFQRRALGIHSQLVLINQEINVAKSNLEQTFVPSVSAVNHAAIRSNMSISHNHILRQSRRLVDLIGIILTKKK